MSELDTDFDSEVFIEWLDGYQEHKGVVLRDDLYDEWPTFPAEALGGVTGPIVDGEFAYYKRDLRLIARRGRVQD